MGPDGRRESVTIEAPVKYPWNLLAAGQNYRAHAAEMGGATDIAMAASTHGVEMVLVSLADLDPSVVRDITEACTKLDVEYRLIPALSDVLAQRQPELVRPATLSHEGRGMAS